MALSARQIVCYGLQRLRWGGWIQELPAANARVSPWLCGGTASGMLRVVTLLGNPLATLQVCERLEAQGFKRKTKRA